MLTFVIYCNLTCAKYTVALCIYIYTIQVLFTQKFYKNSYIFSFPIYILYTIRLCQMSQRVHNAIYDYLYTERQKKHHFFRVTLTKIHDFKINNIWTQLSFNTSNKNIWKTQDFLASKRRKMRLNHKRSFFENRRNCSPSELWTRGNQFLWFF